MKQVTFGKSTRPSKNYTAHDLREEVITFLTEHGMSERHASNITSVKDDTYVYVNPDCANSDFTRALALFQLVFSCDLLSAVAYIAYRPKEGGMRLTVSSGCTYGDVIDYIKEHMEITIA
jgi:hypothetical protein